MGRRTVWVSWLGCGLLVASLSHAEPALAQQTSARPPLRVLFVGNSYTRYNLLPAIVARVARSAGVAMRTDAVAKGGMTLRMHWRRRDAVRRIQRGRFSHVVLQAHSTDPLDRPGEFQAYADRFNRTIERTGAATVLYQTWARRRGDVFYRTHPLIHSPGQMLERVGLAYGQLASQLGASLAPVGRAFASAVHSHPDIELYRRDGAHPSWDGTYLAACVLFGAITGESPRRIAYAPWEVPAARAARLREIASHVLDPSAPAPSL